MRRCLELARSGAGRVAPNPMVGAVLVHETRIIGEGYHQNYGQAHAEVNCIRSVAIEDESLIEQSVLYVSLEPCVHFGKTPPCTDLIIARRIPKVVIGCRDPFPEVNGKGIEKLKAAGVAVETGVLENSCRELNKRFFTFHQKHRPYIILKWAESLDGKLANADYSRVFLTNEYSDRKVHKWRAEEGSILVGTNTALHDDPSLNLRYWQGQDPIRMVLDQNLRLPENLKIFKTEQPTLVFNAFKDGRQGNTMFVRIVFDKYLIINIIKAIYELKVQSVMIEGGARILQSFIDIYQWDEARVIVSRDKTIGSGILSPVLGHAEIVDREEIGSDSICYYARRP